MTRRYGHAKVAILGWGLTALGCSVPTEHFDQDADLGTVHAIVQIRRAEMYDGSPHGDALAAFVQVPPAVDSAELLSVSGLWAHYPEVGNCAWSALGEKSESKIADVRFEKLTAELLSADQVDLRTAGGLHALSPHAFPSTYDLLRGVVFSSPDQYGGDLPANDEYTFVGSGIETALQSGTIDVRAIQSSPAFPQSVAVMGVPFESESTLAPASVLDWNWSADPTSRDRIVIAISTSEHSFVCSFNDADGAGTIPLVNAKGEAVWNVGSEASLSVHRIRTSIEEDPKLAEVMIEFDFSLEKTWVLAEKPMTFPQVVDDVDGAGSDDNARASEPAEPPQATLQPTVPLDTLAAGDGTEQSDTAANEKTLENEDPTSSAETGP